MHWLAQLPSQGPYPRLDTTNYILQTLSQHAFQKQIKRNSLDVLASDLEGGEHFLASFNCVVIGKQGSGAMRVFWHFRVHPLGVQRQCGFLTQEQSRNGFLAS